MVVQITGKSFHEYDELRAFGNVNKNNNNIKCRSKKMKGMKRTGR